MLLPDGSSIAYTYDGAHRLVQIRDGLGNRIDYTLDGLGNRTREDVYDHAGVLSRTRTRTFDALSRLAADIGALNQTTAYTYDNNGNLLTSTDPLGQRTTNTFDALDRLVRVTDPAGGVTQYAYDQTGLLRQVNDPRDLATGYFYDGLGNQVKLASPDTGVATQAYDAAGNLFSRTDARGVTASYSYDAANRVTAITYSKAGASNEVHAFEHDGGSGGAPNARGRLTKVTDPAATTTWTYTPHGRVATKSQQAGAAVHSVAYTYNAAGQLSQITTPSGQQVGYSYLNGRVGGITVNGQPLLSGVVTQPFGPVGAWRWGNGQYAFRSYDADGRLASWEFRNGASLLRKDLAYDAASRIVAITDPLSAAQSGSYQYDALDRLTTAQAGTPPVVTRQYGYDALGNRLMANTAGAVTTQTYGIGSNQLLAQSGTLPAGFLNGDTQRTFKYNLANRLVEVGNGVVTGATYAVNALGQRVQKVAGGITTRFVYDEQGRLVGEYDGTGKLIQETVWLEDLPVATLRPTGATGTPTPINVYYVHADHLGSPRAITRPSDNAIVWRWTNVDPFGANLANENPAGAGVFKYQLRFPGQYFDAETGTHYNYFRDYDPSIGRYSQSDPIGLAGGLNTFAYADNRPITIIDPTGLAYIASILPPDWQSTPPGRCSKARYDELKYDQDEACGKKYSCSDAITCREVSDRISNAFDCLSARKKLMDECFGGGDFRHRRPGGPIDQILQAIKRCQDKAKQLGCC